METHAINSNTLPHPQRRPVFQLDDGDRVYPGASSHSDIRSHTLPHQFHTHQHQVSVYFDIFFEFLLLPVPICANIVIAYVFFFKLN